MAKITYEDKVPLNEESEVADINKVTADNLNSIKKGINDLISAFGLDTDTWVSGTTYAVGDMMVYNNILYKCTIANSDTEFTASNWEIVPILVDK